MANFIDMAGGVLSQATRQVEIASQNMTNVNTPGYKRRVSFADLTAKSPDSAGLSTATDFSAGKPVATGNPYDIAVLGDGFFCVRTDSGVAYTRQGQFKRDSDGRVVTPDGHALQLENGGDLVVKGAGFTVQPDGSVTEDGELLGKLDLVAFDDPKSVTASPDGLFRPADDAVKAMASPAVRQGAYEASNVSGGAEMISIMGALRQAETGQKLVGVYDDLMGRVLSTLGQGGGT